MKFTNDVSTAYVYLDLYAIAADLAAHPGRWGLIEVGGFNRLNGKASGWRRRGAKAFPIGLYEFTCRSTKKRMPDGSYRAKLYGRYVGGSLAPAPSRPLA